MLIKTVKEKCPPERLIEWLQILTLMDDTVLLSTSRENIYTKLRILKNFCCEYDMRVNNVKTKLFVIIGERCDDEPFGVGEMMVEHCTSYTYLSSSFTCDGSVLSAVKLHAKRK